MNVVLESFSKIVFVGGVVQVISGRTVVVTLLVCGTKARVVGSVIAFAVVRSIFGFLLKICGIKVVFVFASEGANIGLSFMSVDSGWIATP